MDGYGRNSRLVSTDRYEENGSVNVKNGDIRVGTYVFFFTALVTVTFPWHPAAAAKSIEDYYNQGFEEYKRLNFAAAIDVFEKGLKASIDANNKEAILKFKVLIGKASEELGVGLLRNGALDSARTYLEKSLSIAQSFRDQVDTRSTEGGLLNSLGVVYMDLGEITKALSILREALRTFREVHVRYGEGKATANLGVCYWNVGAYPRAISFLEQAVDIQTEAGDLEGVATILSNLGLIHAELGDAAAANRYLDKARVALGSSADPYAQMDLLLALASGHLRSGSYAQASGYFASVLQILRSAITSSPTVRKELAELGLNNDQMVALAESAFFKRYSRRAKQGLAEVYLREGRYADAYKPYRCINFAYRGTQAACKASR